MGTAFRFLPLLAIPLGAVALWWMWPGTGSDRAEKLRAMKAQAKEFSDALLAEDYDKVADLTHPRVMELAGSRQGMIDSLKSLMGGMKSRGTSIVSVDIDDPTELVEAAEELFGVIPYTLALDTKVGRGKQNDFMVGVSNDGGRSWKFISTGQKTPAAFKQLLPNFPEDLRLPRVMPPVMQGK